MTKLTKLTTLYFLACIICFTNCESADKDAENNDTNNKNANNNTPSNQNIEKLISDGNNLYGVTSASSIYFSFDNGFFWVSFPLFSNIFRYGVDLFEKVDNYLFINQKIG